MSDHTSKNSIDPARSEAPRQSQGLAPEHTFVVQLRGAPAVRSEDLQGRVEHVVSGAALRFRTTAELVAFLNGTGRGEG
jgi:hypothetical protein